MGNVRLSGKYQEKENEHFGERMPNNLCTNMKCCPISNTFNIIGKKFTILILRNMMILNQTRFHQFMDSIDDINPKTLSIRLREMEKDRLIERKVYHEVPVRIEYTLTEKAMALTPVLEQMALFSMKYCSKDVFRGQPPKDVEKIYSDITAKYQS